MYSLIEKTYSKNFESNKLLSLLTKVICFGYIFALSFLFIHNIFINSFLIFFDLFVVTSFSLYKLKIKLTLNIKILKSNIINNKKRLFNDEINVMKKFLKDNNLYKKKNLEILINHYREKNKIQITNNYLPLILELLVATITIFSTKGELSIDYLYSLCAIIIIYYIHKCAIMIFDAIKGTTNMYCELEEIFTYIYFNM